MKNINKSLIKNIGISILAIIAILLIILVISYDKISIGKVIPTIEEYELSNEIQEELESEEEEDSEVITTYELDATDLKEYESTNEYNKGKKNPFAEETDDSSSTNNTTTTNTTTDGNTTTTNSTESTSSSSSENFYEDDGTK